MNSINNFFDNELKGEFEPARMKSLFLHDVIQECYNTADSHGFHTIQRTFGDACSLIHSEVTEAFEGFRNNEKMVWYEVDGKVNGVASEIADVVIRCFDTAVHDLQIPARDFAGIIQQKMEYNKRRPYLHGGKVL